MMSYSFCFFYLEEFCFIICVWGIYSNKYFLVDYDKFKFMVVEKKFFVQKSLFKVKKIE